MSNVNGISAIKAIKEHVKKSVALKFGESD